MFKLQKPTEITINQSYIALLYGKPGIGKTTTALSSKNPVLLDFDNGIARVSPEYWAARLEISQFEDVLDFVESDDINEFSTIVVDTMGAMVDKMMEYIARKNPKVKNGLGLSQQGYGHLKALVGNFVNTLKSKNKNIIYVAHEIEKESPDGEKVLRPNMGPGSGGQDLINKVDIVGFMDREGEKTMIRFTPYGDKFYGKNSLDLPASLEVPNPKDKGRNTWFQDVIDLYYAKKGEHVYQLRKEYENAIEQSDIMIDKIKDAKTCNEVYSKLSSDDKFRKITIWKQKLSDKIKPLGIVFNVDKKVFENAAVGNA